MPHNNRFRFTYNWNNKLDCRCYTTLRLHNPSKHIIGHTYDIWERQGTKWVQRDAAQIIDIKTLLASQINPYIAALDTGYSVAECQRIIQRMYKDHQNPKLDFILLRSIRQEEKPQSMATIQNQKISQYG